MMNYKCYKLCSEALFYIAIKCNHKGINKLCNGISFSIKREWLTDTYYNLDEPQKHYAKFKKPMIKAHIFNDTIYMNFPEQANQ